MKLKKINETLQQNLVENGFVEATEVQQESFSTIKSGADCVIIAPKDSGKTTTIAINVIQQLAKSTEESPRALIIVENKEKMLEMVDLLEKLAKNTPLEIYGVHDKSDLDQDKNNISAGVDILVGTPTKLNEMLSTAGYNVNRLKMFIVDDIDTIFKLRLDSKIARISNTIAKTQRIFFLENTAERIEIMADTLMIEPFFLDFFDDEDEEEDEEVNE